MRKVRKCDKNVLFFMFTFIRKYEKRKLVLYQSEKFLFLKKCKKIIKVRMVFHKYFFPNF